MTKKVFFTTWHYKDSATFLESIIRLTPECKGKWGNIEYTLDKKEADYIVVFGGTNEPIEQSKALYFGLHPKEGPAYKNFENTSCLAAFPIDKYLNPGEVWIDYTYDELMALQPPKKKHNLACITTRHTKMQTYLDRIMFLHSFLPQYPGCHLYGRPQAAFEGDEIYAKCYKGALGNDEPKPKAIDHITGKNVLIDYRYSLEFDQKADSSYYICERFYDAMLLWTLPLYYGTKCVEKFFPENSFRYINIETRDELGSLRDAKAAVDIVNSDFREMHIKDMAEARMLMLNKYQVWPMLEERINNIDYYVNEWRTRHETK